MDKHLGQSKNEERIKAVKGHVSAHDLSKKKVVLENNSQSMDYHSWES